MMNNFIKLNEIIKYIEDNLDSEPNIELLAKSVNLSVYEFRRIFSFAAGVPIGEYIRKRRMSRAAEDIIANGNCSVTALAEKYGYDAPSSFSRAFKDFHGCSPNEIMHSGRTAKMFTPLSFEISVGGGHDFTYSILQDDSFTVCGFAASSGITDTECCENVWLDFYQSNLSDDILSAAKDELFAIYQNGSNDVNCVIGAKDYDNEKLCKVFVPKTKWMCFKAHGFDDKKINCLYENILYNCLPSSIYERNSPLPNVEIFPQDMENPDFEWEIRIPVRLKGECIK